MWLLAEPTAASVRLSAVGYLFLVVRQICLSQGPTVLVELLQEAGEDIVGLRSAAGCF